MQWHFQDVHGFKDYVGFVKIYATNGHFPAREGGGPDEQWTLDLAFDGLRDGMKMAVKEKGSNPVFCVCDRLVEEAYTHYREGRKREGFFKLEELQKLLNKVPTH